LSNHIISIGGGGFGRSISSSLIEKYILSISENDCPRICFLPTASGDNDSYIVRFYSIFTQLNCVPTHIDFFKRTIDINNHIMNQDIIFVGGGNTKSMLAVWSDWGMNNILTQAYNQGVIMSGVSAGAICWFTSGITDSWNKDLHLLPCLGLLPGNCCPHYDEEASRIPYVEKILLEKTIDNCVCIEGGAAIHFIDGKAYKNISFYKNKNTYNVYCENNVIMQNPYKTLQL